MPCLLCVEITIQNNPLALLKLTWQPGIGSKGIYVRGRDKFGGSVSRCEGFERAENIHVPFHVPVLVPSLRCRAGLANQTSRYGGFWTYASPKTLQDWKGILMNMGMNLLEIPPLYLGHGNPSWFVAAAHSAPRKWHFVSSPARLSMQNFLKPPCFFLGVVATCVNAAQHIF